MAVRSEAVEYRADGLDMVGQFFWDDRATKPAPAVLVFPEAFGLGDHAKGRAERLVGEFGYAALACDLHGGGAQIEQLEDVMTLLLPLQAEAGKVRARTGGAHAALLARPEVDANRIAAIGFCFGGTMSYELALSGADIKAAIGFHSGLAVTSPDDAKHIKGKVLALIGADDPGVPAEQRAAFEAMLRQGGVDWQMHLYGGVVHSFTNRLADVRKMPDFLRYDAVADMRSWSSMAMLLAEVFA